MVHFIFKCSEFFAADIVMLDLKVMRLSPPQFSDDTMESFIQSEVKSAVLGDGSAPSDAPPMGHLLLPTSLTKVLIGETFVAYLHLVNNSAEDVSDVSMVAEMKTNGSNPDVEMYRSSSPATLQSGKFLETIVSQVLLDRGVHTVDCCVRYKARGEMRVLR